MRKNCENGRSMVEMLGVLAIIGVLSVGGIAGYSKAMFKHKINKTLDIISGIVANIVELDTKNLGGEISSAQDAVNYGIMPDCDVNYSDVNGKRGKSCQLPLGSIEFSYSSSDTKILSGGMRIKFLQNPIESCVAFLNSGIYNNVPEEWWNASDDTLGGYIAMYGKIIFGKSEINTGAGAKSILTAADIANACALCDDKEYCEIHWQTRWSS